MARAEGLQAAPVAPSRVSVLGRAPGGNVAQPPAPMRSRTVVAKTTPPPAPVPFAARQQALQANPGRPLDQATLNNLRASAPAAHAAVRPSGQSGRPAPGAPQVLSSQPPARPGVDRPASSERPLNQERALPTTAARQEAKPAVQEDTRPAAHEARKAEKKKVTRKEEK